MKNGVNNLKEAQAAWKEENVAQALYINALEDRASLVKALEENHSLIQILEDLNAARSKKIERRLRGPTRQ